jgi:hypothetical protein
MLASQGVQHGSELQCTSANTMKSIKTAACSGQRALTILPREDEVHGPVVWPQQQPHLVQLGLCVLALRVKVQRGVVGPALKARASLTHHLVVACSEEG